MTEQRTAWGWGLASIDAAGNTLDVWYPELTLGEAPAETSRPNHNFGAIAHDEADARGVRRMPVFTVSKLDEPIEDAADAYLRLHLLSMRLAKPNTLNLDGIFAKLNNVVCTNSGTCCRLTSSPAWSTTSCRPACASATPTACDWARTCPKAPPSCTPAS